MVPLLGKTTQVARIRGLSLGDLRDSGAVAARVRRAAVKMSQWSQIRLKSGTLLTTVAGPSSKRIAVSRRLSQGSPDEIH
jgi:hypothetical protein